FSFGIGIGTPAYYYAPPHAPLFAYAPPRSGSGLCSRLLVSFRFVLLLARWLLGCSTIRKRLLGGARYYGHRYDPGTATLCALLEFAGVNSRPEHDSTAALTPASIWRRSLDEATG